MYGILDTPKLIFKDEVGHYTCKYIFAFQMS